MLLVSGLQAPLGAQVAIQPGGPPGGQVGGQAAPGAPPGQNWRDARVIADELLVRFRTGTLTPDRLDRHRALDAQRLERVLPDVDRVRTKPGADLDELMEAYAQLPEVELVGPNVLYQLDAKAGFDPTAEPFFELQWHLDKVRAPLAWPATMALPEARVAVLDTGVDSDHPDLEGNLIHHQDTYDDDQDAEDTHGHGTHCVGIAGAVSDNGVGVAGAAGRVAVLAYRCGQDSLPTSALLPALADAVARDALVVSMSFVSAYEDPLLAAGLQDAHDAGCLLVAAAGNQSVDTPYWPAAHDFVLGVGSTEPDDSRSTFSNHGDWVSLAAPGSTIYSTYKNGSYAFMSGTSMATPLVAGMATRLYGTLGPRSLENAAAVRAALESSAVPVGDWVQSGRADFRGAVDALFGGVLAQPDEVQPTTVVALGGTDLRITGDNLQGLQDVTVDGISVEDFWIESDGTLFAVTADAYGLGPADLRVRKNSGFSNSVRMGVVQTDPPRMRAPTEVPDGGAVSWSFGGRPGDWAWLLASLDPFTMLYQGDSVLQNFYVLAVWPLNGIGLGELQGSLPPGLTGITFYSQVVMANVENYGGASNIIATSIVP